MPTIEYITKAQGQVLKDYRQSWNRVEAIMGPLGSGKTIESCQKLFDAMCKQEPNRDFIRPSRWYAVRNTYSDLLTTTVKDWLSLYGELGKYSDGNKKPPTQKLDFDLEDGTTVHAELVFIALDRPDSVKKLRGSQVTGFWLNEMKELPKAVVDMADLRHGRYPSKASGGVTPTWHGMLGDTNAPDDDHWYYNLSEEVKPESWRFHKQPGGLIPVGDGFELNPDAENLINLPDGYYMKGMEGKAKDWILVNLCNEYGVVMSGKPVYPEYVDSVHCMKEFYKPDPRLPIILGCDFGRTPACAFIQYDPDMGRYIGFDEFNTINMSASTFAPELKRYIDMNYPNFKFEVGGADPAGKNRGEQVEVSAIQILRKHGINVQGVHTNDPLVRRSSLVNNLTRMCMDGKPAFMISPKCKMWRKGLNGGFCYLRIQVIGDEKYKDQPDKNKYSHICEAGEYGLMSAGEGRKALIKSDGMPTATVIANTGWDLF